MSLKIPSVEQKINKLIKQQSFKLKMDLQSWGKFLKGESHSPEFVWSFYNEITELQSWAT